MLLNCIIFFSLFLLILHIINRLTCGITRSSACLVGKTAIVTGANSGLGFQTTLNLASRGCKIIMADINDMEETKQQIINITNNSNIITKYVDLSSFKSVRDFATDIHATVKELHILVNNGGIGVSSENKTIDGYNPVMQINYFSHFLLTHLLIDLLKRSAPSRIVFTSSIMAFFNNLSVKKLSETPDTDFVLQKGFLYGNSKLGLLIVSDIFAEKLKGTGVTSNSVHPGVVATSIWAKSFLIYKNIIYRIAVEVGAPIIAKDPWEGSQTLVHVAVAKELENISGKYFWDCIPFVKPWCAYKKGWCKKIWEATEKIVNLAPHEQLL